MKKFVRRVLPLSIRRFVWLSLPQVHIVNTYALKVYADMFELQKIPDKYELVLINKSHIERLKNFYNNYGTNVFRKKVPKRLNSSSCRGFAFVERKSGEIVYNTWIHFNFNRYLSEYGIQFEEDFAFWDSGDCLPDHRHQGLHTRMEQELIKYAQQNNYGIFSLQIHESNSKGNDHALAKGYSLIKQSYTVYWPAFGVYRELKSFLMNPFKRIIK